MKHVNKRIKRPDIKLKWSFREKIIEVFTLGLLISYWLMVLYFSSTLQGGIPIHFNFRGDPTTYGNKENLWTLPKHVTAIYVLLTVVSFFPRYFNYLEEITPENAEVQYKKAVITLRILKIIVLLVYMAISTMAILHAEHYSGSDLNWIMPFFPYVCLLPIFYYLFSKD